MGDQIVELSPQAMTLQYGGAFILHRSTSHGVLTTTPLSDREQVDDHLLFAIHG
ncbi:MAG: hypothetical protein ACJ72M_16015 [Propionibacteriaceae bacterium]